MLLGVASAARPPDRHGTQSGHCHAPSTFLLLDLIPSKLLSVSDDCWRLASATRRHYTFYNCKEFYVAEEDSGSTQWVYMLGLLEVDIRTS